MKSPPNICTPLTAPPAGMNTIACYFCIIITFIIIFSMITLLRHAQAFPQDVQIKLKDAALCSLTWSRGRILVHKVSGRVRPNRAPYLAPEVLLGNRPRRAADTYAFGILMWELYTGECII